MCRIPRLKRPKRVHLAKGTKQRDERAEDGQAGPKTAFRVFMPTASDGVVVESHRARCEFHAWSAVNMPIEIFGHIVAGRDAGLTGRLDTFLNIRHEKRSQGPALDGRLGGLFEMRGIKRGGVSVQRHGTGVVIELTQL